MGVVLGINPAFDSSAAIAVNGEIKIAIAEERITRKKHHAHSFQACAIHALKITGYELHDIDLVVVCRHGLEEAMKRKASRELLAACKEYGVRIEIAESHHNLHAICSFSQSPFSESAVLVLDGLGTHARHLPLEHLHVVENQQIFSKEFHGSAHESMSIWHATLDTIDLLQSRLSTHNTGKPCAEDISIGRLYSYASRALFASRFDAGKVMALAAFGKPLSQSWVKFSENTASICREAIEALTIDVNKYSREDLAASAQKAVEQVVLFRAARARELTKSKNLCLSGGVFLNCVANHLLVRSQLFDDIFCPSAPSDDGIAIGAALYGSNVLLKPPSANGSTAYLGTPIDSSGLYESIKSSGFNISALTPPELVESASAAIWQEGVILWHVGRSEFGPRALGHRSILGNPFSAGIKDRINNTIKHRESFRPVAPLVLAAAVQKYFGFPRSRLTDLMLESLPVLTEFRTLLNECVHVDGSARVQTISPDVSPQVSELLLAFEKLSGHPILINTSLNGKDSPICESPEDTLNFFAIAPINTAFIGSYKISKHPKSTQIASDA